MQVAKEALDLRGAARLCFAPVVIVERAGDGVLDRSQNERRESQPLEAMRRCCADPRSAHRHASCESRRAAGHADEGIDAIARETLRSPDVQVEQRRKRRAQDEVGVLVVAKDAAPVTARQHAGNGARGRDTARVPHACAARPDPREIGQHVAARIIEPPRAEQGRIDGLP